MNLTSNKITTDNISYKSPGLKYLPECPSINIEFNNLIYSVPGFRNETESIIISGLDNWLVLKLDERKEIINNISGQFRSNELTAIMGPSGGGKTTLLNLLAGYKAQLDSGEILINGNSRNMKLIKKISRYIMQNEVLDKYSTVRESMLLAANLKLGNNLNMKQKNEIIDEILDNLRLRKAENTMNTKLSGGEKKRLSIAMELVDNPPLLFLDEPTTGLDDLSSFHCISLLKKLAKAGRTIICSIHTPSAKLFQQFDNVYILAKGQCAYQGSGHDIVPFMESIGLTCPITYNPADFIIEACSGDYGTIYLDKMINLIENGKCFKWIPGYTKAKEVDDITNIQKTYFEYEIDIKKFKNGPNLWQVFKILFVCLLVRRLRDKAQLLLNILLYLFLMIMLGGVFHESGSYATKGFSNFGFAFGLIIISVYMPLMPVLSALPIELKLVKREYFNQWYTLGPYYCAMMLAKIPFFLVIGTIYATGIYLLSSQPMEFDRYIKFLSITIVTGIVADCFAVIVGSRFNIVNGLFIGSISLTPMILLSYNGVGNTARDTSIFMKIIRNLCFLRHSLLGILAALYDNNRADTICPEDEIFCPFKKGDYIMKIAGTENPDYLTSMSALLGFTSIYALTGFLLIKDRLSPTGSNIFIIKYINEMYRKIIT